jgi:hypothetical protein
MEEAYDFFDKIDGSWVHDNDRKNSVSHSTTCNLALKL